MEDFGSLEDKMELDDEILRLFIEDSQDNLSGIENDLLAIEAGGENLDDELIGKVFRAVHSIKGSAGFVGLENIKELAHGMENIFAQHPLISSISVS